MNGRKWWLAGFAVLLPSAVTQAHPHAKGGAWTYEAEQAARQAFAHQDWATVAEVYGEFAEANPFHATFQQNRAYALHSLGRHAEAAAAWELALALGYQPATTMYNLACANARAGKTDEALDWLERALRAGFEKDHNLWNDADLETLRAHPRFKQLTGFDVPESPSREQGWRYDLEHMARRMEWMHYDLYRVVPREKFREAIDSLEGRVSTLSDDQVILEMQRIAAMVGDGHTTVMLFETFYHGPEGLTSQGTSAPRQPKFYPIDLYLFGDGLFVRDAAAEYADLIGRKVSKIGDRSPHEAMMAVAPYIPRDNDMGIIAAAPFYLTLPPMAGMLGFADAEDRLRLETEIGPNQTATTPIAASERGLEGSPLLRMAGRGDPKARSPKPLYLRDPERRHWFEYLKDERVVYAQINAIQDDGERTLAGYVAEVMENVEKNDVRALVIDIRLNSGGNGFLNKPLIQALVRNDKINQPGKLFVIIGRRTFSAAMNLATEIENWCQPIFVGEPTGSRPNAIGETSVLTLPWSKLRLSVSSLFHQNGQPRDERTWIAPRLPAELQSSDYFSNRDPAMEAVLRYLDRPSSPTATSP